MRVSLLSECGVLVLGVFLVQSGLTATEDGVISPETTPCEDPVTTTPSNKNATDNVDANGKKPGSDIIRIRRSADVHPGLEELLKHPKVAEIAKLLKDHGIDIAKLLQSGTFKNLADLIILITTNPTLNKVNEGLKSQGVNLLKLLRPPGHSHGDHSGEVEQKGHHDPAVRKAIEILKYHGYTLEDLQTISDDFGDEQCKQILHTLKYYGYQVQRFQPLPYPGTVLLLLEFNRDILAENINPQPPSNTLHSGHSDGDHSGEVEQKHHYDPAVRKAIGILLYHGYTLEDLETISGDFGDEQCQRILQILKYYGYQVQRFQPLPWPGTVLQLLEFNRDILAENPNILPPSNTPHSGHSDGDHSGEVEQKHHYDPAVRKAIGILLYHGYTLEDLETISGDLGDEQCQRILQILKYYGYQVQRFQPVPWPGTVLQLLEFNRDILAENPNPLPPSNTPHSGHSHGDHSEEVKQNRHPDPAVQNAIKVLESYGYTVIDLQTISADFRDGQCQKILYTLRFHGYEVHRFRPLPRPGTVLQLLEYNRDILEENPNVGLDSVEPPSGPLPSRFSEEDLSEEDDDMGVEIAIEILRIKGFTLDRLKGTSGNMTDKECKKVLKVLKSCGYKVDDFRPLEDDGSVIELLKKNNDILESNEDNSCLKYKGGDSTTLLVNALLGGPEKEIAPPTNLKDSGCPTAQYLNTIFSDQGYGGHLKHIISTFRYCGPSSQLYEIIQYVRANLWFHYRNFVENVVRNLHRLEGLECRDLRSLQKMTEEPIKILTRYGTQLENKISDMEDMGQCY